MKKKFAILFLFLAVAVMASVNPLTWESTSLELGQVKAGESVSLEFTFTNTSDQPVSILEAKGSCGCTVVDSPNAPIAPGESASIQAVFKSGKAGMFRKSIAIKTSANEEYTRLFFSGEVVD